MEHISTSSFDDFHRDIDIDEGGETKVPKYGAVVPPRLVEKLGNTAKEDGLLLLLLLLMLVNAAAVVVHAGVLSANNMSMV